MIQFWVLVVFLLGYAPLRCHFLTEETTEKVAETVTGQVAQYPHKIVDEHLPNAIRLHPRVISGGLPAGKAAFARLQSLGIQTIISVDGAKPDVAMAQQHGLRYLHLPHGYDGISKQRIRELAKAIHCLDGPFYIHCHHGKHRSPVAAGVACVAAGLIPSTELPGLLQLAGTSPKYRGLLQTTRQVVPLDRRALENLTVEFRQTTEVPPLAQSMVALQSTYDHLLEIAANGWVNPHEHPDLHPAHEALLLKEHFQELARGEHTSQYSDGFRELLAAAEREAKDLEDALNRWDGISQVELAKFDKQLHRTTVNCQSCHQLFRDVPIGEKRHSLLKAAVRSTDTP